MLPNQIWVMGIELELVKKRGRKNNRAYRMKHGSGHIDIEFTDDPTKDAWETMDEIVRAAKTIIVSMNHGS